MLMEKDKTETNTHAYLTQSRKGNPQPFAYTKIKIPLMNKQQDLIPLTPNKKFTSGENTPIKEEANKEFKALKKDQMKRRRKINSLITERNDREYYLSLNTNPFKVKMEHLKKMNNVIQEEISNKIINKSKQLQVLKQHQKILNDTGRLVVTKGTEYLYKKGMTVEQLKAFISNDRELKSKKFKIRVIIKDIEGELQQLEYRQLTYKKEFEKKKTNIQIDEYEHREKHQFRFEVQMKNPKMKRSLNRKRALLHDTLHSKLGENNKVTAFETKEGEEYTIDLLRK